MFKKKNLFILCLLAMSNVAYSVTFDHWNFGEGGHRSQLIELRSLEQNSWLDHAVDAFGVDNYKNLFEMICRLKAERDEAYLLLEKLCSELDNGKDIGFVDNQDMLQDEIDKRNEKVRELLASLYKTRGSVVSTDNDIDFLLDTHELLKAIKEILGVSSIEDIEDEIIRLKEDLREVNYLFDKLIHFTKEGNNKAKSE
jgi:hypothetical protein